MVTTLQERVVQPKAEKDTYEKNIKFSELGYPKLVDWGSQRGMWLF